MADQPVYVENELFLGRLDEQDRFREVLRSRDPDLAALHGDPRFEALVG